MLNKMTSFVQQINGQPLQPETPSFLPSIHLHSVLIGSVPAVLPPATVYGLYTSLYSTCISDGDGELDGHYLSPSPPQLSLSHPLMFPQM